MTPTSTVVRVRVVPANRRMVTLGVTLALLIVLVMVGAFVRVPYVSLGPGPTVNTLGTIENKQVVMISGDAQNVADNVAAQLGIDRVFAGVRPQDKAAKVVALQRRKSDLFAAVVEGGGVDLSTPALDDLRSLLG